METRPSIIATNEGGDFKKPDPGSYVARIYKMIHYGHIETKFGWKNTVRVYWELPTATAVFDEDKGEQPFSVSREYTISTFREANLTKMATGVLGRDLTPEEEAGFDVTMLLGLPCVIGIKHSDDGKYANIVSVGPMMKDMVCPEQVNDTLLFTVTAPDRDLFESFHEKIQEKIKSSREYKELLAGQQQPVAQAANGDKPEYKAEDIPADEEPDDLPF